MGLNHRTRTDLYLGANKCPGTYSNPFGQRSAWVNNSLAVNHPLYRSAQSIVADAASAPSTSELTSNFQIPRRSEIIDARNITRSPGTQGRLNRKLSTPASRYIDPSAGVLPWVLKPRMPAAWAMASISST